MVTLGCLNVWEMYVHFDWYMLDATQWARWLLRFSLEFVGGCLSVRGHWRKHFCKLRSCDLLETDLSTQVWSSRCPIILWVWWAKAHWRAEDVLVDRHPDMIFVSLFLVPYVSFFLHFPPRLSFLVSVHQWFEVGESSQLQIQQHLSVGFTLRTKRERENTFSCELQITQRDILCSSTEKKKKLGLRLNPHGGRRAFWLADCVHEFWRDRESFLGISRMDWTKSTMTQTHHHRVTDTYI